MVKCEICGKSNSDFAVRCNVCGTGLSGKMLEQVNDIINELKSADNEGTRAPYWLILDPRQNMSCDIHQLAAQITAPFFSRKSAQDYLDAKRHHYSDRARVFCHSGHFSKKYENLCKELKI